MPTLKYWDIPSGGFTVLPNVLGPQGVQGPQGPPGLPGASQTLGVWLSLPYAAGWTDYTIGWRTGQYMKDSAGWVYLRGLIIFVGTVNTGASSTICTLPSGFRPAAHEDFQQIAGLWTAPGGSGRVDVHSTGVITYNNASPSSATNIWFTLSGVTYRADGS
jgi:hypothetical protein